MLRVLRRKQTKQVSLSLAVWRHFTCYIFFVFTYYFVLSLKNKYTILLLLCWQIAKVHIIRTGSIHMEKQTQSAKANVCKSHSERFFGISFADDMADESDVLQLPVTNRR